jgi:protein TonB
VTLESTTVDGSFSAPVGDSPDGKAPERAEAPSARLGTPEGQGSSGNYRPQAQVTELPVLLDEVKVPYPPKARKEGREGSVVLMIAIDDKGAVTRVRKISGAGPDLDEAAIAAVRQFRFRPARYAGETVGTEIRYVYSFEIN